MDKLKFENETGTYCCDACGRLLSIRPRDSNCLCLDFFGPPGLMSPDRGLAAPYRVGDLIIPEGVRSIECPQPYDFSPEPSLRDMIVAGVLRFPSTLESLGAHTLTGSLIMDMEMPATLGLIGSSAIMQCYIRRLRLCRGLGEPENGWSPERAADGRWRREAAGRLACGGRQFKGTIIGTLLVPKGYPYQRLMPEARIDEVVAY